jgi:hypothetical protein
MAEKAIYLLSDPDRLNQFSKQAIIQASKFEISKILPVYEQYYFEILEKSKTSSNLK